VSVGIGFVLATATMYWIVGPVWNYPASIGDSAAITLIFTVISLIRSYAVRRGFEWWLRRA
jgi:hypothetical protein